MKLRLSELRELVQQVLAEKSEPDAGPFKAGDVITFGKYKNKRGKIKKVFNDEKDHVAVEIEPTPKGRKKNVEMGLYKLWPAKSDSSDD